MNGIIFKLELYIEQNLFKVIYDGGSSFCRRNVSLKHYSLAVALT